MASCREGRMVEDWGGFFWDGGWKTPCISLA